MGYARAGFEVVGVDIHPQPRFPFEFIQADALTFPLDGFDAIHASPPCQAYTDLAKQRAAAGHADEYPDLIASVRTLLRVSARPWVMENVDGAPLKPVAKLCGSWFGLNLWRHRIFESNIFLFSTPCSHSWQLPRFRSLDGRQKSLARVIGVHGHLNYPGERELRAQAMGIDWMTSAELVQAIPPAYAEFVGKQLMRVLESKAA